MTLLILFIFFFTAPATTEIYTLSLHDALPISWPRCWSPGSVSCRAWSSRSRRDCAWTTGSWWMRPRSEEHTSELQSRGHLVCRLLLEKKKKKKCNNDKI